MLDSSIDQIMSTPYLIIESVDSLSRDGPDMPYILYVIHYKKVNNLEQIDF